MEQRCSQPSAGRLNHGQQEPLVDRAKVSDKKLEATYCKANKFVNITLKSGSI